MLNVKVCENCWMVYSKGNKNASVITDWWYCAPYAYRMEIKKMHPYTKKPPDECPYILEHLVNL
jgi:hypothetical protein